MPTNRKSCLIYHTITTLFNGIIKGNSVPMEIEVREEMRINSTIGKVRAIDEDLGENAEIDYAIVDGNDNKIFEVKEMC